MQFNDFEHIVLAVQVIVAQDILDRVAAQVALALDPNDVLRAPQANPPVSAGHENTVRVQREANVAQHGALVHVALGVILFAVGMERAIQRTLLFQFEVARVEVGSFGLEVVFRDHHVALVLPRVSLRERAVQFGQNVLLVDSEAREARAPRQAKAVAFDFGLDVLVSELGRDVRYFGLFESLSLFFLGLVGRLPSSCLA